MRLSPCFALFFVTGSASSISALKPKTIQTMANQVFEAARTLMAVREYQNKEIPDDVLRRIVEAAHLTASAANRQEWHFVLVQDRERRRKPGALVATAPDTPK